MMSNLDQKQIETALWDLRGDLEYYLTQKGVDIDIVIDIDQYLNKYIGLTVQDMKEGEFDVRSNNDDRFI